MEPDAKAKIQTLGEGGIINTAGDVCKSFNTRRLYRLPHTLPCIPALYSHCVLPLSFLPWIISIVSPLVLRSPHHPSPLVCPLYSFSLFYFPRPLSVLPLPPPILYLASPSSFVVNLDSLSTVIYKLMSYKIRILERCKVKKQKIGALKIRKLERWKFECWNL